MTLYDILGLPPTATDQQIKNAYRTKAMLHHPDRSNGDKDEFQKVQEAYDVLSDPERRAVYDVTGSAERRLTPEEQAAREQRVASLQLIRGSLMKALQELDEAKADILEAVRQTLQGAAAETRAEIKRMTEHKEKAERAAKRVVADDETLVSVLKGLSEQLDGPLAQAEAALQSVDLALSILEGVEYVVDIPTEAEMVAEMRARQAEVMQQIFNQHFGRGSKR